MSKPFKDIGRVSYIVDKNGEQHYQLHIGRDDHPNEYNTADNRWETEKPHHGYRVEGRKWATPVFALE